MEGEAGDIQDWEVLPTSETELVNSAETMKVIEGDSERVIRYDYFSIGSLDRYANSSEKVTDWLHKKENFGEFLSDQLKSRDIEGNEEVGLIENGKRELSFIENDKSQVGLEGNSETRTDELIGLWSDSSGKESKKGEFDGVEEKGEIGDVEKSAVVMEESGDSGRMSELEGRNDVEEKGKENEVKVPSEVEGKKMVVWWKLPLELLKYCVSRANPVWSLSMAAAFVGLVILGRRLRKMKQKSRSLQIKVTVDDKKVSQFMSRAARLNEAFSVVKRVPLVRPSLPAAGMTPWPAMSLR